jgi:hypothetical protein
MYKTIILIVILYECETWSLVAREDYGLRVSENKVMMGRERREQEKIV